MAKAAAKKAAPKSGVRDIKYADKSAGQQQLVLIFNQLRQMLMWYVKGAINTTGDKPGQLHLYSDKTITINGKARKGVYFASIMVQKGYVGFYLMPVYTDEFLKKQIPPELLKCLKGKACFHIKKLEETLISQVKAALEAGYSCYKEKDWA